MAQSSIANYVNPGNARVGGASPGVNTEGRRIQPQKSNAGRYGSSGSDLPLNLSNNFSNASRNVRDGYVSLVSWFNEAGKKIRMFSMNFGAALRGDNYSDNYDIA